MLHRLELNEWQAYVEAHPDSTVFHHRNWLELLSAQYQLPIHMPAVKQNGEIAASLPFLETTSIWGAKKLVSLPYTDCVRVLARDEESARQLCIAARIGLDYPTVVLRTDQPSSRLAGDSRWVRHVIPLDRPANGEQPLPASLRRNLRKAAKNKLTFHRNTGPDGLEDFYRLHLMTRRRLGIPIQPKSFFRRLYERIVQPGFGFVGLVRQHSDSIAAGVFLTYNRSVVYKYGASNPRALAARPNDYLFSNVIRMAKDEGCVSIDLGVSKRNDIGLRRFKKKWGAQELDVHDDYLVGNHHSRLADSSALRFASFAIRNSPPAVCRAVGEVFYRYSQ